MGKTFVEDERPCDQCVNRTRYGCASWDCKFIDRDEAIKAWKEKHEIADRKAENNSEIPTSSTISKMEQVEDEPQTDEFELFDREALILLIECQRERIAELLAKTEPQTYVINPQEPTNDDKCFECDDFFTCGGQCNKIEDEPQTDCSWR